MASGEDFDYLPGRNSFLIDRMESLVMAEGEGAVGGAEGSSSNEELERRSTGPKTLDADDDDASLLVYRWGFNRSRRPRRIPSTESESESAEHLVAGPPMLDFNEPLPLPPPNDEDNHLPSPISSGDLVPVDGGELPMAHAVLSVSSMEDLQSVVSQLGLETCAHTKASCHSHGQQTNCCRVAAAHNISLESLDLDTNNGIGTGHGHVNHCCHHPLNRFKRGLAKRSCQFFQ